MTENIPQDGSPQSSNILDWIVTNYLGAKIQSQHIRNYAGANLALNHGRDIAKKLGLDPAQITPFPCPTNISVNQETPLPAPAQPQPPQQSQSAMSMLAKAGVAAALLGTGAGAVPVAGWIADKLTAPAEVQPATSSTPATPEEHANVGFEIR